MWFFKCDYTTILSDLLLLSFCTNIIKIVQKESRKRSDSMVVLYFLKCLLFTLNGLKLGFYEKGNQLNTF